MRLVIFIVSLSIAVGVREATSAAETVNIASSVVVAAVATALTAAAAVVVPSVFAPLRHVPEALIQQANTQERMQVLGARPQNTKAAYGDVVGLTSGPAKEWALWCAAGPEVLVYGLLTRPDKVTFDTIVTPEKKQLYLSSHLSLRPELNSACKPIAGTQAGRSVIKKHSKMLSDLYVQQRADHPGEMADIAHPREASSAGLINVIGRGAAKKSKETYSDPGLQHRRFKPSYTQQQLTQIGAFGLADSARKGLQNARIVDPLMHFEAIAGHDMLIRNDDSHELGLTSPFVFPSMLPEGPQECYIFNFGFNDSKMNVDGHTEIAAAMRHRYDPLLCVPFALGYLLFNRWTVAGLPIPEFKPRPPNEQGIVVRKWYNELLLPGFKKARMGQPVCR
jgi:hypothetical protein